MTNGRKGRIAAATLAAAFALGRGGFASAESLAVLPGHIPRQIRGATRLERVPADERVDLNLVVRVDQALLEQTLARLYGPKTPKRKRFLTSVEFVQKFDLAAKRQKLKDFARSAGLAVKIDGDQPGSLVVKVYGPSRRVETAFGVQLQRYRSADGRVFRANDSEPSIPESLRPHLNAVLGLSNFRGALKSRVRRRSPGSMRFGFAGRFSPPLYGGTGPGAGLAPADIKSIYSMTTTTMTGSGQTIALFELDGYAPADVTLYERTLFYPPYPNPSVSCVSQDDSCSECGADQNQTCDSTTLGDGEAALGDPGMIEVALDIEMLIALAPKADILVYTALNDASDSLAAYAKIASDDSAQVVSTSWGEDEEDLGSAAMSSEAAIFAQMAAQGQAVFAAAGDAGAYDASGVKDTHGHLVSWAGTPLTDDPASQTYVTGVGGTSLSGTIGNNPSETVWNEGCSGAIDPGANCALNGAGGGGVASYDGDWSLPSYQSLIAGTTSQTYRNVPDVALYADPDTAGYAICVGGSCDNCGSGGCTTLIGGTSAATPLWAALTALVNQRRAEAGAEPLGFANPSLYELGTSVSYRSVFNDVTGGDNGHYIAGTGYDNASGWGSFQGDALIAALSVPATIVAAVPEFTNVGVASVTVNWSPAGQLQGTIYAAQISSDGFNSVNAASVTGNAFASFGTSGAGAALAPATTYYFRVQASSGAHSGDVSSLGYTETLAAPPTAPSLTQVWTSSMTLQWTADGNPVGTQYRVDYWQAVGSTGSLFTTSTAPTLTSLAEGATYFVTVGALNDLGELASSGVILSTVTIAQASSTTYIPATGGVASIHPPPGLISLTIPGNALTQSLAVTLAIPTSFPTAPSPAGNLTGTGLGIQISASPAVEPLTNTLLSISYQAPDVAGLNPRELVVARYDPIDGVWVPLVSSVDAVNKVATGVASHWSLFQLMQDTPSQTIATAKAFPNPWRVAQGPTTMTFSLLPAGARLRLYTLAGRLVKDFSADASGMASWDGTNESGRPAASGFYFVYVEGAGQSATLKVALQR